MKKIFLCAVLLTAFCLTGCGTVQDKDIRDNFIKDTEGLKSYYMEGVLKITNNDDSYEYDVKTSYKKDNFYKVSLVNKANKYEQLILKNEDGVYVITPSLNKSFKFQSDWPNNNSQSYLIDSVATDLKNDTNYSFTKKNDDYVFTIKTNYPNNPKYTKQNIYLDKDKKLKKVEVLDDDGVIYVEYIVRSIDENKNFSDLEFSLNEITKDFNIKQDDNNEEKSDSESDGSTSQAKTYNQDDNVSNSSSESNEENTQSGKSSSNNSKASSSNEETSERENTTSNESNSEVESSKTNDNVFPLYLPSNTSLSDKEVIDTNNGQRIIMTFSGDNPFIFVQETVKPSSSLEVIPTYGEPFMLVDTVGSLTDTSYTWTSNGVEYYIVSDQMDKKELLEVAKSVNVMSVITEK